MFIIKLPLVYMNELTLYHLIPQSICRAVDGNSCLYIKPKYKHLIITKSREHYTPYNIVRQIFPIISGNTPLTSERDKTYLLDNFDTRTERNTR